MNDFPRWLAYLPASLRKKIGGRPYLLKIVSNMGWLLFDRILRMGLGLLVGVWVARYLGPEQFGSFNYAMAFVGLFTAFSTLGLNGIVVRDLIRDPAGAQVTLGTAFVLQILGGLMSFFMAVAAVSYAKPGDESIKVMVAVLGFAVVFKATEVIKFWFESKVQSRSSVWLEGGVFVIASIAKVVLILNDAPLIAFVWIVFFESSLVALGLIWVYSLSGYKIVEWKFRFDRVKTLLADSWPLVLSGIAAMVYMRIDQIMLGQILGDSEVGIFSAAVRITETCYVFPMVIVASVFPSIMEAKRQDDFQYKARLKKLFDLMSYLSLLIAVVFSFFSEIIVSLLYGAEYQVAASVLAIQAWAGVFVYSGIASGRWFLVENLQRYSFYRALAGAFVNVGLNFVLIPKYGASGAAVATVVSQAVASVLLNAVSKKTRPIFFVQMNSMFFVDSVKALKRGA